MPDIKKTAQVVFTGDGKGLKDAIGTVSRDLAVMGTAATAAFAAAAQKAGEFETSVAEVSTMVDTSVVNMDRMGDSLERMSALYGKAAPEMARAQYQVLSAGVDAAESIDYLDVASRAAVGGVTNVKTAVDGLTTSTNAWGKESGGAQHAADVMFTAVRAGKTTFEELSGSIGKVASQSAAMGISMEETYAAVAALTTKGIATSEAVSYLRGMLASIIKPSKEAQDAAAQYGIELSAAAVKAKGLTGFLADLREKTGGDTEAMSKLVGSVEGLQAALALTGDGGRKMTETMDAMKDSAGAADEAFAKLADTAEFRMAQAKEKVNAAWRDMGTAVTPVMEEFAEAGGKIAAQLGEIAESPAGEQLLQTGAKAAMGATGVALMAVAALKAKEHLGGVVTAGKGLVTYLGGSAWGAIGAVAALGLYPLLDALLKSKKAAEDLEDTLSKLSPEEGGSKADGNVVVSDDAMSKSIAQRIENMQGYRRELKDEQERIQDHQRLIEKANTNLTGAYGHIFKRDGVWGASGVEKETAYLGGAALNERMRNYERNQARLSVIQDALGAAGLREAALRESLRGQRRTQAANANAASGMRQPGPPVQRVGVKAWPTAGTGGTGGAISPPMPVSATAGETGSRTAPAIIPPMPVSATAGDAQAAYAQIMEQARKDYDALLEQMQSAPAMQVEHTVKADGAGIGSRTAPTKSPPMPLAAPAIIPPMPGPPVRRGAVEAWPTEGTRGTISPPMPLAATAGGARLAISPPMPFAAPPSETESISAPALDIQKAVADARREAATMGSKLAGDYAKALSGLDSLPTARVLFEVKADDRIAQVVVDSPYFYEGSAKAFEEMARKQRVQIGA